MKEHKNVSAVETKSEQQLAELLWAYDEQWRGGVEAESESLSAREAALDPACAARLENGRSVIDLLAWTGQRLATESSVRSRAAASENAVPIRDLMANDTAAESYFALGNGSLPLKLDRFEIIRELGRGGLGIVFLAHDPLLGREVALKAPRPEALLSVELRQRFEREGKAAARLTHPNIVPVYEVGRAGLIHFIAAAYIAGPSLSSRIRRCGRSMTPRLAAEIVAALADGIGYAHSQRILHRDLKPANILLEPKPNSECGATGRFEFVPRITDFGLAKLQDVSDGQTAHRRAVGHPCLHGSRASGAQLG